MKTQSIWPLNKAEDLLGFRSSPQSLALWRRKPYPGSAAMLDSILPDLSEFRQILSPDQVRHRLASAFPARFWRNPLALDWLDDVTGLVGVFCRELEVPHCQLQFDKQRPCVRYHADNVPLRLVCTYRGPGTLWLDEDNVDLRAAEAKGTCNEDIVLRPEDVRQAREWDVLVMKGKQAKATPLYHKSPPSRPGDPGSLVLKLDVV
ncbi:MAG: DUF1826 domain-containing protein [Candidatus Eremiobacteraeota bacterium]|nr:DUF1826 domain-containing protein [Candidatus Eremiobacteraeota bacterium]MCW5869389.1 DUF1826 domain-containing protein [Candidatus Eremiobacteraeota bacterium]